MVQIIPAAPKKPSFLNQLGHGVGRGLEEYGKMRASEAENGSLKKMGIDLSGIQDPKIRAAIAGETLKGNLKLQNQQQLMNDIGNTYANLENNEPDLPNAYDEGLDVPDEGIKQDKPILPRKEKKSAKRFPETEIAQTAVFSVPQANLMQKHNDKIDKDERLDKNLAFQEKKEVQKEKVRVSNETKKYYEGLGESAKEAEASNRSLKRQEKLIGEVGWLDRAKNLLKPQIQDLIKSDSAIELDSNIAEQIASKKTKLGGILTTAKLNLLMSKLATSAKSPEANKYIIDYNTLENDLTIAQFDIASEIIKENDGYRPANFEYEVSKRLNTLYGDRADDLYNKIESLPDDPKQLEKVWRRKVPQGTPLTQETAMKYKKMYGKELGKIKAAEDGYVE